MLFYGCETWRMTKRDEAKLDTFLHKRVRRIPRIYWPMRVLNEEVRRPARTCTISVQVKVAKVALDRAYNAHGPQPESVHCFNLGNRVKEEQRAT